MPDDPFLDVIQCIVEHLDRHKVSYAITGSVASGVHGEPVHSQDVDIALRMLPSQARDLAASLPSRFYRSAESLEDVARDGGMANLIDSRTGLKIDLSVLEHTPYFNEVMARRVLMPFDPDGTSFYVVTAEDIILMKLLWRRESRSEKQWSNALSVARVKRTTLDWKYLLGHARSLGIEDDLVKLRGAAGI
jgi:hypothetical protein